MIPIPRDRELIDWPTSTMWFDEDGVLYSVPKPGIHPPLRKEELAATMDKFREITGGKKVCMILETNSSSPPPKREERERIAKELDSVTKAMAIIATSPLSRMIANIFFALKPPGYPARFFSNVEDAKAWIRQYL